MTAPLVKPQYGPTLPALVRRVPRRMLVAAGLAAVLAVGAIAVLVATRDDGLRSAVVRGPVTFNLVWTKGLRRVEPRPGELLRLRNRRGAPVPKTYAVRRLRLPAYPGEVGGFFPLYADRALEPLRRSLPGFAEAGEGKARINGLPGYAFSYEFDRGGRRVLARRVLLLVDDEPGTRDGVQLDLEQGRSREVTRADLVGAAGPLKTALRSFRLGTERP